MRHDRNLVSFVIHSIEMNSAVAKMKLKATETATSNEHYRAHHQI